MAARRSSPTRDGGLAERVAGFVAPPAPQRLRPRPGGDRRALAALARVGATDPRAARLALRGRSDRLRRDEWRPLRRPLRRLLAQRAAAAPSAAGARRAAAAERRRAGPPPRTVSGQRRGRAAARRRRPTTGDGEAAAGEGRLVATRVEASLARPPRPRRPARTRRRPNASAEASRGAPRPPLAPPPRRAARRAGSTSAAPSAAASRRAASRSTCPAAAGRDRPLRIVALCDVSGSMALRPRLPRLPAWAWSDARPRADAYLFHTRLAPHHATAMRDPDPIRAAEPARADRRRLRRRHPHRRLPRRPSPTRYGRSSSTAAPSCFILSDGYDTEDGCRRRRGAARTPPPRAAPHRLAEPAQGLGATTNPSPRGMAAAPPPPRRLPRRQHARRPSRDIAQELDLI